MGYDVREARLAASEHQCTAQHQSHGFQSDGLVIDMSELEAFLDFPCPYCNVHFDISSLCSHLRDEHSGESKIIDMCPVCLMYLSEDIRSHINRAHGHLIDIQRCSRLRPLSIPNSQGLFSLGRELREYQPQFLRWDGLTSSNSIAASALPVATDPSLSSFITNFQASETEEVSKYIASSIEELSVKKIAPSRPWKNSDDDPPLSYEERERRMKQATGRASFMQDLFLSAMLGD